MTYIFFLKNIIIFRIVLLHLNNHNQSNENFRGFVNLIFQYSLVSIVNKPTRVTKSNATLIDYIIPNSFTNQQNFIGILKTDIFDHFSNF